MVDDVWWQAAIKCMQVLCFVLRGTTFFHNRWSAECRWKVVGYIGSLLFWNFSDTFVCLISALDQRFSTQRIDVCACWYLTIQECRSLLLVFRFGFFFSIPKKIAKKLFAIRYGQAFLELEWSQYSMKNRISSSSTRAREQFCACSCVFQNFFTSFRCWSSSSKIENEKLVTSNLLTSHFSQSKRRLPLLRSSLSSWATMNSSHRFVHFLTWWCLNLLILRFFLLSCRSTQRVQVLPSSIFNSLYQMLACLVCRRGRPTNNKKKMCTWGIVVGAQKYRSTHHQYTFELWQE